MHYIAIVAAVQQTTESRLLIVLVQLTVIILAARVFAVLFRRYGQPAVVGEIVAGLVLGPSVLGRIENAVPAMHGLSAHLFNPSVDPIVTVLSQLGLIFLLFLIGLEFDFSHLRLHGTAALSISLTGILLPFAMGFGLAHLIWPHVAGELPGGPGAARGFELFMGTAISITAIPILGRIMMELNITRTRLGALTISAAAVDDATAWILLATVSALVRANFNVMRTVEMIGLTVAFALAMVLLVRPILVRLIRWEMNRTGGELQLNALAVMLAALFLCAMATSLIGIFAIFGAFILGAVLSTELAFRAAVVKQLQNFVTVLFLPIFFTYTGLRTNIGSLNSGMLWLFAAAVLAVAVIGKFGGCAVAARLGGFSLRESACVGVMMNTRALMELIVINVGYELGVIPRSVFCMLVMMAVITTLMAAPILLRIMEGTELQPYVEQTTFRRIPRVRLAAEV